MIDACVISEETKKIHEEWVKENSPHVWQRNGKIYFVQASSSNTFAILPTEDGCPDLSSIVIPVVVFIHESDETKTKIVLSKDAFLRMFVKGEKIEAYYKKRCSS